MVLLAGCGYFKQVSIEILKQWLTNPMLGLGGSAPAPVYDAVEGLDTSTLLTLAKQALN